MRTPAFPMTWTMASLLLLSGVFMSPVSFAQEAETAKKKKGGGANATTNLMKQLKGVTFTADQTAKLKEIASKSMGQMREIRKAAGLTPELMKKRADASKELRESGKKGADLVKAVNEKAGLSEEQIAAVKKADEVRLTMMKTAIGMLTDEQKANVPKRLMQMVEGKKTGADAKKGKGKGKKKKEDADKA